MPTDRHPMVTTAPSNVCPSRRSVVRNTCRWMGIVAVATGVFAATGVSAQQAQPRLQVAEIKAGIHLVRAEIADEPDTRARGLMFREHLGPNEGMLFVFQSRSPQCFWMRNTPLPLSIAFIDDDGRIVNVEDMQPRSDDSHCSARPVRYALEMAQGWFARRGLGAGAQLTHPKLFSASAR